MDSAKFKGIATEVGASGILSVPSDDGQVVSIIFSNLSLSLSGQGGTFVATRTVSFEIPIDHKEEVHLTQTLQGYVDTGGSTRAVLVIQAAGETTVVNLKEAKVQDVERNNDAATSKSSDLPGNFNYLHTINRTVPVGAMYLITLFLLLERDVKDAESQALLTVDNLDIEIMQ